MRTRIEMCLTIRQIRRETRAAPEAKGDTVKPADKPAQTKDQKDSKEQK
jgi:hypothetical protein